jgi:tape measure domain-containing protein
MSAHTIEAILTAKDQGMSSTFDKMAGKAESFGSKLKSGLGFGMWSAIGQKAIGAVTSLISSSMGGAVKRLDTLNQFPNVMQTLGYSAKDAESSINTLGDGIQHLPTTLDAVANQTKSIVAVVGDLGKATDLTLALNNAMTAGGASAEQASSAINQWTQAMAKGKPDLQDWRALVQTAPAQMNQLAEATLGAGKTQNDLYEAMKNGSVTIDEVNDKMIELTTQGGDGFKSWEEQAKSAGAGIQMSLTNVRAGAQRNIANVMDSIDKSLEKFGGFSGIIQGIVPVMDFFGSTLSKVADGSMSLGTAVSLTFAKIGEKAEELIPIGMSMVGKLIEGIAQSAPSIINSGIALILRLVEGVGTALPQLIVTGLNAITNLINGLSSGQGALSAKAVSIAGKIIKAFVRALPQILTAGINLMVALLRGIGNGFRSIPSAVASKARQIPKSIKRGVGNLAGIGRDMIAGLWNGIKAKFDSVVARVRALASSLPKAVKKVLGIGSPSRVFKQLGAWTGEGFALGIASMNKTVEDATLGLVSIPSMTGMGMGDLAYEYGTTASYEISVPLYINGREFARATAGDMSSAINQRDTRQNRLRGVR